MSQSGLIQKYGKGPFFLGWHEIRQLIYESLPPGVVKFNSQVSTASCITLSVSHKGVLTFVLAAPACVTTSCA